MPHWIDPKISVGNLITIVGLVLAWIFGYANLQGRVNVTEVGYAELKIQSERRDMAKQREQNLANRLDDIRSRMERMEKNLDAIR